MFPFVFIGHGEINPEYLDKCEECYIWFKRAVLPEERKGIMKNCPPPLAGFFHWADDFVHFGSNDDTYDYQIYAAYAPEKYKAFFDGSEEPDAEFWNSGDFNHIMEESVRIFPRDIEKWILEVNAIVQVAFFIGPNGASSHDPWNKWSMESIPKQAIPYISSYTGNSRNIFSSEYTENGREIKTIKIKGIEAWVGEMSPGQVRHIYSYIARALLNISLHSNDVIRLNGDELRNLVPVIDRIFRTDGVFSPVESLTVDDSIIKSNSSLLEKTIAELDFEKQIEVLDTLDPYTQLVFYASRYKCTSMLAKQTDYLRKLSDLIGRLPDSRKPVIASLLVFMANNLLKIGPAFEKKYDLSRADIAANIIEMSFDYPEVTEESYINAAFIYDSLKNYEKMLEVSLKGYHKFPQDAKINANILYSAQKLGKNDIAEKYAKSSEELALTDPLLLMNQTYTLIINGDFSKAKQMINNFVSKGGKLTPELLANVMYTYTASSEDDGHRDLYLSVLLNYIKGEGNIKFKTNPDLVCNATIVLNNLNRFEDSQLILDEFKRQKGLMSAGLYNQYMYSAIMLKNRESIESTLKEFIVIYDKNRNYFDGHNYIFATASNCYALQSNSEKTIEFLKTAKEKEFDIAYIRDEADYQFLTGSDEFKKLF